MRLFCTCRSSWQPTPQYGQIVDVTVCLDSSQVPRCRRPRSSTGIRAPVGHTATQLPQNTQRESSSGVSAPLSDAGVEAAASHRQRQRGLR